MSFRPYSLGLVIPLAMVCQCSRDLGQRSLSPELAAVAHAADSPPARAPAPPAPAPPAPEPAAPPSGRAEVPAPAAAAPAASAAAAPVEPAPSVARIAPPTSTEAPTPIIISPPVTVRYGGVDIILQIRPSAGASGSSSAGFSTGSGGSASGTAAARPPTGSPQDALTSLNTEPAYSRVAPQLTQLPPRVGIAAARFPPKSAAVAVLGVLRYIDSSKLTPQYESLSKSGLFEMRHLTDLRELAQATWYVANQLEGARKGSAPTESRLSPDTLDSATKTRERMMRVLEFHFLDDPDVAGDLTLIRGGVGNADLAKDLIALAKIYKQHRATLAGTPKYYQVSDETTALQLADRILAGTDGGAAAPGSAAAWQDSLARVSDLLATSYEEVRRAGLFLCRTDPTASERFPTLAQVGRRAALFNQKKPSPIAPNPN